MNPAQKIKKFITDTIFPVSCIGCGSDDTWLCHQCFGGIAINKEMSCPECRLASSTTTCNPCKATIKIDGLIISTKYEDKLVQNLIKSFKYNFIPELARPLSKIMIKRLYDFDNNSHFPILYNRSGSIIIPVPLHKKRLLARGFNQSALIAEMLANQTGLEYQPDIITRIRFTQTQTNLSRDERIQNLKDAFVADQSFNWSGKNAILVDDVATTLSTLNECAGVLKKAGCKEVWAMVIARGSQDDLNDITLK